MVRDGKVDASTGKQVVQKRAAFISFEESRGFKDASSMFMYY